MFLIVAFIMALGGGVMAYHATSQRTPTPPPPVPAQSVPDQGAPPHQPQQHQE
ncbi:hypothetical protein [Rhodopila globiformis]|uniref:hypothetical protein n=1 Tax=Rhodopila globiformis TaxID=1071 RepID=UPI001304D49B|nr:hypothetical protein [Rhodopila globiformis]